MYPDPPSRFRLPTLVLALLAALLVWPPASHADPVPITSGEGLDWGLRASWRNYIGPAGTTLSNGATRNADGTFHFQFASGSYDAATRATVVRFKGTAQFLGHCEGAQPFERPCALDMTLIDPWIEINEDRALLHARLISRPREGGEIVDHPDVAIAALGAEDATLTVTDGKATWSALSAVVTLEGSEVFTYGVGVLLDPVRFSYDGAGGKPLGEVFAEAGAPVYTGEAVAGSATLRPRFTVPGRNANELYGIHLGGSRGLTVVDRTTFATVPNSHLDQNVGAFGSLATDPASGTVFTGTSGANQSIRAFKWDGTAWTNETVANSAVAASTNVGGAAWDPAGKRYLLARQTAGVTQIWEAKLVAGVWTAANLGNVRQTNTLPAPLIQSMVVVPNGGTETGSAMVVVTWFGQLHRLHFVADGIVAEPLAQAPGVGASKLMRTDNGVYAIMDGRITYLPVTGPSYARSLGAPLPAVTVPGSAGLSSLDTGWTALDPGRDTLFVPSLGLTRLLRIEAGVLRHSLPIPGFANLTYYADFLPGTTTAGNPVVASDTKTSTFALTYQRTTPSFITAPADTTVNAGETATLKVAAVGDPAPTVRWQSRVVGGSGWSDVGTGNELPVAAAASDSGRQYRAIATNAAGEVASTRATLTVRTAPTIAVQPENQTVAAGSAVQLKVMPGGSPDPVITWQQLVGGFWREVDPDSGDFDVDGGFLTIKQTRSAMDGAQFRARVVNPLGTVFSNPVTITVQTPITEPVTVRGGTVDWGFANRWRCYVVGSVAKGGVETTGGITRLPGTLATGTLCAAGNAGSESFRFPVTGGAYDPAAGTLAVTLGGTVRFWGHMTNGVAALNTTFSQLRIAATKTSATLYGTAVGATLQNPTPVTHTDIPLATINLTGSAPTRDGDRIVFAPAPTALTAQGSAVFGGYPAGEPFDPISFSLSAEPTAVVPDEEDEETPPVIQQTVIQHITQVLAAPVPVPAAPRAPTITPRTATQTLSAARTATLATISCAATCTVTAPKRVNVTIAGKRYAATITATKTTVRVQLSAAAAKRLKGRKATVSVKVTAGATTRTLKVAIRAR